MKTKTMKTKIANLFTLTPATLLALLVLAAVPGAKAATYTWTQTAGGAQSWATGGNWSGSSSPSLISSDTVDFSTVNIATQPRLYQG